MGGGFQLGEKKWAVVSWQLAEMRGETSCQLPVGSWQGAGKTSELFLTDDWRLGFAFKHYSLFFLTTDY
jgi:hypothetical protein